MRSSRLCGRSREAENDLAEATAALERARREAEGSRYQSDRLVFMRATLTDEVEAAAWSYLEEIDEMGGLVDSFNVMTRDLLTSKLQVEAASQALRDAIITARDRIPPHARERLGLLIGKYL